MRLLYQMHMYLKLNQIFLNLLFDAGDSNLGLSLVYF